MSGKQQRAARSAGTTRGRRQAGRGVQHAHQCVVSVDVQRPFNPGWCVQEDETRVGSAPQERCVAEAPLRNGVMVVLELDRFLMDAPPNMRVVHLNGDYWDYRKENLSLVAKPPRDLRAGEEGMEGLDSACGGFQGPFHPGWSPQVDEVDDGSMPGTRWFSYVALKNGALAVAQLDRFLMDAPLEMKVVHLNGIGDDNTAENLKFVPKPHRDGLHDGTMELDAGASLVFAPARIEL